MKTFLLFLIAFLGFNLVHAQDDKAADAYYDLSGKTTTPPYSLAKIKGLIGKIKEVGEDDDNYTAALATPIYAKLTVREKFTYNMIHAESHAQGCDADVVEDENKKIVAQLRDPFGDDYWSERQRHFFKENKDSCIGLMTESIQRIGYVGLNYKNVIVDINATSMIPLLIDTYNKNKLDRQILTVLLLLMKNNKYPPFMNSTSYKKLYANRDETSRRTWLIFNTENEALIIQRATDFYNGLAK